MYYQTLESEHLITLICLYCNICINLPLGDSEQFWVMKEVTETKYYENFIKDINEQLINNENKKEKSLPFYIWTVYTKVYTKMHKKILKY